MWKVILNNTYLPIPSNISDEGCAMRALALCFRYVCFAALVMLQNSAICQETIWVPWERNTMTEPEPKDVTIVDNGILIEATTTIKSHPHSAFGGASEDDPSCRNASGIGGFYTGASCVRLCVALPKGSEPRKIVPLAGDNVRSECTSHGGRCLDYFKAYGEEWYSETHKVCQHFKNWASFQRLIGVRIYYGKADDVPRPNKRHNEPPPKSEKPPIESIKHQQISR